MPKKKPVKPPMVEPNRTTVTVSCPRYDSFRVQQVAGMFDLQPAAKIVEQFAVEIPTREELIDGRQWQIGCIVGPSGSGKSSVARQAYGQELYGSREWPADRAVIDCFELAERAVDAQSPHSLNRSGMSSTNSLPLLIAPSPRSAAPPSPKPSAGKTPHSPLRNPH